MNIERTENPNGTVKLRTDVECTVTVDPEGGALAVAEDGLGEAYIPAELVNALVDEVLKQRGMVAVKKGAHCWGCECAYEGNCDGIEESD